MAEESAEDLMATKLKGELRSALRIAEDIQALKAKMSMLMEVVREDKERKISLIKKNDFHKKNVSIMSDHMERVMAHLRIESKNKVIAIEARQKVRDELTRAIAYREEQRKVLATKDRYIHELGESGRILDDQLLLMEEKKRQIRGTLDYARHQHRSRLIKIQREMNKVRAKYNKITFYDKGTGTALLDAVVVPSDFGKKQGASASCIQSDGEATGDIRMSQEFASTATPVRGRLPPRTPVNTAEEVAGLGQASPTRVSFSANQTPGDRDHSTQPSQGLGLMKSMIIDTTMHAMTTNGQGQGLNDESKRSQSARAPSALRKKKGLMDLGNSSKPGAVEPAPTIDTVLLKIELKNKWNQEWTVDRAYDVLQEHTNYALNRAKSAGPSRSNDKDVGVCVDTPQLGRSVTPLSTQTSPKATGHMATSASTPNISSKPLVTTSTTTTTHTDTKRRPSTG